MGEVPREAEMLQTSRASMGGGMPDEKSSRQLRKELERFHTPMGRNPEKTK